jgi:hypothetical protein
LIGQISGLFYLNSLILLIGGLLILVLDFILYRMVSKGFTSEKLV